jgi:hypothetical protein
MASDDDRHTVTVTFKKSLRESEDVYQLVRSCLEGDRAGDYTRDVHVTEIHDDDEEPRL